MRATDRLAVGVPVRGRCMRRTMAHGLVGLVLAIAPMVHVSA